MSYQVSQQDKTATAALRRIARAELRAAIKLLEGPDSGQPAAIHGVRKSIKRLRGLLSLVEPGFAGFDREDKSLREAARHLAPLREKDQLRATIAHLKTSATPSELATLDRLRRSLPDIPAARSAAARLADCGQILRAMRKRAKGWKLRRQGFAAIATGLSATWRRAKARQKVAERLGSAHAIHDWRKEVKHHGYQAQLLAPIRPARMLSHAEAVGILGELLGDHHDLAVLEAYVTTSALDDSGRKELAAMLHKHQARLVSSAQDLAARTFDSSRKAVVKRWRNWWQDWRATD